MRRFTHVCLVGLAGSVLACDPPSDTNADASIDSSRDVVVVSVDVPRQDASRRDVPSTSDTTVSTGPADAPATDERRLGSDAASDTSSSLDAAHEPDAEPPDGGFALPDGDFALDSADADALPDDASALSDALVDATPRRDARPGRDAGEICDLRAGPVDMAGRDECRTLSAVNGASQSELVAGGLSDDAVRNIVGVRLGDDGRAGTTDDVTFTSREQVDAIPLIRTEELEVLRALGESDPLCDARVWTLPEGSRTARELLWTLAKLPSELVDLGVSLTVIEAALAPPARSLRTIRIALREHSAAIDALLLRIASLRDCGDPELVLGVATRSWSGSASCRPPETRRDLLGVRFDASGVHFSCRDISSSDTCGTANCWDSSHMRSCAVAGRHYTHFLNHEGFEVVHPGGSGRVGICLQLSLEFMQGRFSWSE